MPAKGGGGGGPPILLTLIKMPFSIAWSVVHMPTSFLMWLIIDKIPDDGGKDGRGATWISKWIMRKPRTTGAEQVLADAVREKFQALSTFLKEFREVLQEYFKWQKHKKSGAAGCGGCGCKPEWYDPDSKKKQCGQCAYLAHFQGESIKPHSLEKIREFKKQGFHLVTPILPDLMVVFFVLYLFFRVELMGPDYLTVQVTCPVVSRVRSATASFDANLFYHWKQQFFTWCDLEDSYMRFTMDAWVRSVVTRTDNTLLVFQTFASALLVGQVLKYTLVPIASFLYAILANLVHWAECQFQEPTDQENRLLQLHNFFWKYNGAVLFGADSRATYPPETDKRTRPDKDPLEGFYYLKERWTRKFWYYYDATNVGLTTMTNQLLKAVFVIRIACIWIPGVAVLCKLLLQIVGFGTLISKQEGWYAGASTWVNEDLLRGLAAKLYLLLEEYGLKYVPPKFRSASLVWAFGVFVWVVCVSSFATWLVRHRRAFKAHWKTHAGEHMNLGQKLQIQKIQ